MMMMQKMMMMMQAMMVLLLRLNCVKHCLTTMQQSVCTHQVEHHWKQFFKITKKIKTLLISLKWEQVLKERNQVKHS